MRRLTFILAVVLFAAACGGDSVSDTTTADVTTTVGDPGSTAPASVGSPLIGQWERAEGDFSELHGMIVEVGGDGTTAVILSVPDNPYQFVVGDVKWDHIEETGDGEFTFQDLVREESTGTTSTTEGVIKLSEDGNTIEITFPDTGTVQEWVRSEG